MSVSLKELANKTKATIHGDAAMIIQGVASPDKAITGDLCFISDNKWLTSLDQCKASVVVLKPEFEGSFSGTVLLHENPYYVYAVVSQYFSPYPKVQRTLHPTAVIHETATIGEHVSIAANVVIEQDVTIANDCIIGAGTVIASNTTLGESCHLRANVTLHSHTNIGQRCIIHSGVVIGDDGFGFAPHNDKWERIEQMGNVRIGDDVEIGANSTIDRAAIDSTIISNGVKIDNLVQIGHNVKIGENSIIVACCGIGGSTTIGKNCKIGGAVGMAGHLEVADGVMITGMSQITSSLTKPGASYSSGTGTTETGLWRRNIVRFKQLNDMARTVKDLEKTIKKLTSNRNINHQSDEKANRSDS